jgi:hypothetical protein
MSHERLIYNDRDLLDTNTLGQENVIDGSTLRVAFRGSGGRFLSRNRGRSDEAEARAEAEAAAKAKAQREKENAA